MPPGLRTRVVVLLGVLVLALAGCSWGGQEPGLFSTPGPRTPSDFASDPTASAPEPTNPDLPVVWDALWTSGEGNRVTFRFAVHAVRLTAAATVLDWSVTPLSGPGRRIGEPVPEGTDLGLGRSLAGEQDIALLDVATGAAYRPLANVSRTHFSRCLCTPLFAVTPELRFGQTQLLQLAFPRLALGTFRVDVVFGNLEVAPGVPVTAVSGTPVARKATDLLRTPAAGNPVTGEQTYVAPDTPHRQTGVLVNRVVASRGITSIVWTLHSVDDDADGSVGGGPPVARPVPDGVRVDTEAPADGPQLRVAGSRQVSGARWTTASFAGSPTYECLCSGLGLWARSLRTGGGSAHLATQVGPLPRGTSRVDVLFPGLAPFTDVRVTWVDDVAGSSQSVAPGTDQTWTYDEADPPRGWPTSAWPTPLPADDQVDQYFSRPERILAALPDAP